MTRGHTTRVIFTVKICIFERSNEKSHFSKTKIYFRKKNYTTIIRTYWATNYESFEWLAAVCLMQADISSWVPCLYTLSLTQHIDQNKIPVTRTLFPTYKFTSEWFFVKSNTLLEQIMSKNVASQRWLF